MNQENPSNQALATEALHTKNLQQQLVLAAHPSAIVRSNLSKNPYLFPEVEKLLFPPTLSEQLSDSFKNTIRNIV